MFVLLLSPILLISTFKFQEMIGVGLCFWHSDLSNYSVFCLDRPKNTVVVIEPPGQITEGSRVTLTCRTDANPPAYYYRWNKNGSNTHLSNSEALSFSHVRYEERGEYSCQATNNYGSAASPYTSLRVLCEFKISSVKKGRNTHLSNSETLSFSPVRYEERGEYICQATNTYGSTASPSTSLRVLCELKFQVSRKGHTCFF